ncbi:MAG: nucleotidyltransferase family protein [Candidatus Baltobacteraceae bacterium]
MALTGNASATTRAALVRMAANAAAHARVVMRGGSMAPDLREGMTLEIAPPPERIRRGAILVFCAGARLVAHRVVRVEGAVAVCSGDAQPECIERVQRGEIVGVVRAVFTPGGARVDNLAFRMRGNARSLSHRVRVFASRALPHRRTRAYAMLVRAMSCAVRSDDAGLQAAVEAAAPWRLETIARRHRCAAALCAALRRTGGEHAAELARRLSADAWAAAGRARRLRSQLESVLAVLRDAGIPCAVLKGAARLLQGDEWSERTESQDLDLLVAPHDVERAASALRACGYAHRCSQAELQYYSAAHHHAEPLYPPGEGVPVELHRSLELAELSLPKTWNDLFALFTPLREGVYALGPAGNALHLAIHAMRRPALREIVLLARQLQRLDAYDTARLRGILAREHRFAIRLHGAIAFAAQLAGVPWNVSARAEHYSRWMQAREDLPLPMRARTHCLDEYFGAQEGAVQAAFAAAFEGATRARGRQTVRAIARLGAACASAIYLRLTPG